MAQTTDSDSVSSSFESKLPQGPQRFLAHVVQQGLDIGRRDAKDFVRHFAPAKIMLGLSGRPDLRAKILVETTGIRHKIAMRKPAETAGEDLQFALDEGETDADTIVGLIDPDDRVRYLDNTELWSFVIEGEFWKIRADKADQFKRAKGHMAFILMRGMADHLLNQKDIVEGLGVNRLAECLPATALTEVLTRAFANAQEKKPFSEVDMLEVVPTTVLVEHVPLPELWDRVVVPKIAEPAKLATGGAAKPANSAGATDAGAVSKSSTKPDTAPDAKVDAPAKPAAAAKSNESNGKSKPPPPKSNAAAPAPAEDAGSLDDGLLADLEPDDDLLGGDDELYDVEEIDDMVDNIRVEEPS